MNNENIEKFTILLNKIVDEIIEIKKMQKKLVTIVVSQSEPKGNSLNKTESGVVAQNTQQNVVKNQGDGSESRDEVDGDRVSQETDFQSPNVPHELETSSAETRKGCGKKYHDEFWGDRICGRFENLKHSDHFIFCPECTANHEEANK